MQRLDLYGTPCTNLHIRILVFFTTTLRAGAAWGARGARAPPVFLREGNKKWPNSALQKGLFSIVHPLKLAPCAGPDLKP